MACDLPLDVAHSEVFIAPGNTLSFRFTRMSDEFIFNTSDPNLRVKLDIADIYMEIPRIEIYPEKLSEVWNPKIPSHYTFSSSEVHNFSLSTNITQKTLTLVNGDVLPKQIYIGFVNTRAYIGAFDLNPFVFKPNDLNRMNLVANFQLRIQTVYFESLFNIHAEKALLS